MGVPKSIKMGWKICFIITMKGYNGKYFLLELLSVIIFYDADVYGW